MADNYLEKRYEEVFGPAAGHKHASQRPSLDLLLLHNRSYRGFDRSYVVHRRQLDAMIAVNCKVASSVNMQRLRFRPVVKGPETDQINAHIRMGRGLPHLQLPFPGTEPEAFVVVCSTIPENPGIDIDLGISLQSMSLKAVEMGLGVLIIRNFDRRELRDALALPLEPVAVLAVGKPSEKIQLVPVHQGDDLAYYRRDGIHYVPKLTAEDLTI
ncbi:MAG: nitroreductase family protein [Bacteroidales bacterium]|nr:nitroreductase family protein [Bacteroidales bacterium]